MSLIDRLTMARAQLRLPRRTVRTRLTALYSGLFLVAGIALLVITFVLFVHTTADTLIVSRNGGVLAVRGSTGGSLQGSSPTLRSGSPTSAETQLAHQLVAQANAQHAADLHQLLTQSGIALGIAVVLAVVLGWFMAGRVLRPLRTMATTTQQISEHNLHERLALPGPSDEVKDLADTIDGLLSRLETAFEAQRRFVANASHELRTPLTLDRTLIDIALENPAANVDGLRSTLQELLASGEQQERLIEALLTLASSERGLDQRDTIDLVEVTESVIAQRRAQFDSCGLRLNLSLGPASISGSADLLARMVANLIDNAITYNVPQGSVDIATGIENGHAFLKVANTGPVVPPDAVDRLFRPFQRLKGDRATHPDGHGLGLSIVRAIVEAHGAGIKVQLRPNGGLNVQVHFPPPAHIANGHGMGSQYDPHDVRHERRLRSPITK